MVGWLCACLLASFALEGAANPNALILEGLHAAFSASFEAAPAEGIRFLELANPGIGLTQELLDKPEHFARMADQIPLPGKVYQTSQATYSRTYATILQFAETSKVQNMAQKARVMANRALIMDKTRAGEPTKDYAAYLRYETAYASAQDALRVAQYASRKSKQPVPKALEDGVPAALKDWETKGFKKKFDEAFAELDAAYEANVAALFANLNSQMATAQRGPAPPWYPVTAEPPMGEWLADTGWLPLTWQAGANGQGLSLTMKVKRVDLVRPWLDASIFNSHSWRMQKNGFTTISTGRPADPEPGLMPILVTGVLLAKDLVVQGVTPQGPALGPFTLGKAEGAGASAAPPQIIAFFCEAVPKCPTPDPKLFR